MTEITASRTLVKSPPELWAECSDAESLARHLGEFGEIRIARLEPETAVAWEGEEFSGTVRLEPAGWGTRVVITAQPPAAPEAVAAGPAPQGIPAPPELVEPAPTPAPAPGRGGLLGRLLSRFRSPPELPPPPDSASKSKHEPEPVPAAWIAALSPVDSRTEDRLWDALESLGSAHRRPFSRA